MSAGHVTLAGEVLIARPHSVLFRNDEDDREHWIPRAVCVDGDTLDEGDTDVIVGAWFVKKEGIA